MPKPVVKVFLETYPDHDAASEEIRLRSHWNWRDRIVLVVRGQEFVVLADDLERAIKAVRAAKQ